LLFWRSSKPQEVNRIRPSRLPASDCGGTHRRWPLCCSRSVYESIGNWQQAETTYQKALTIQPDNALAANNLAYLLLEHGGSPNAALSLAETARRAFPSSQFRRYLGLAYYNNAPTPLRRHFLKMPSKCAE